MAPNLSIFLVEDDRDDQWIFTILTREISSSINCVLADSGPEALAKLSSDTCFTPQLIFLDFNMPGMNGIECLREIKKMNRLVQVPVYVYSTSTKPQFIYDCKKVGAADVIKKDTDPEAMKRCISRIIQQQNKYVMQE